jgi:hypothetical protein
MHQLRERKYLLSLAPVILALFQAACSEQADISFFVLVKSSNYSQDSLRQLTLLNYHFFSEIFVLPGGRIDSASLSPDGAESKPIPYVDRGGNYYVEGGHFDSLEELDAAHPNGKFVFDIAAPTVRLSQVRLSLAGPGNRTDIPAPITVSLSQAGVPISPQAVDPTEVFIIGWSDYSNGAADPRGIVDDMIFVVVADCHGNRLFHTGLPFEGEYMTFRTIDVLVPAGTLDTGQPYSAFVEFPHVVDSRTVHGVPGFTSYATATYLDLRTGGSVSDPTCPAVPPPMDTGQTDRKE